MDPPVMVLPVLALPPTVWSPLVSPAPAPPVDTNEMPTPVVPVMVMSLDWMFRAPSASLVTMPSPPAAGATVFSAMMPVSMPRVSTAAIVWSVRTLLVMLSAVPVVARDRTP